MEKLKNLARLAVVAVLTTGVFAGISGPANADDSTTITKTGYHHRPSATVNKLMDTGWG